MVCAGQDFSYNLGAIDPDGDSLEYNFGPALVGAGSIAGYISPYSYYVPFPYLGAPIQSPPATPPAGIFLDLVTGDLRFRPIGNFVSLLVILVKQWKEIGGTPTLMGTTRREIQIYSQACVANKPPVLYTYDSVNTLTARQPNYYYSFIAGKQLCFTISARDSSSATDSTDLSWNAPQALVNSGATFVKLYNAATRGVNGPKYDSMRFCWTPPASMVSNFTYYFIVTGKDRACPLNGRIVHSFSIRVNPDLPIINRVFYPAYLSSTQARLGGNITNGGSSAVTKSGIVYSLLPNTITGASGATDSTTTPVVGSGIFTFNLVSLNPNTKYYYRAYALNNSGISYTNQDSFVTNPPIITSLPDTTVAFKQDSILLDAGVGYTSYNWSNGSSSRTTWGNNGGKYYVTVTNGSANTGSDTTFVIFLKGIQQKDTAVCVGSAIVLNANSNNAGKVSWSTGDTTNAISINALNTATYRCTVRVGSFAFNDSVKITTRPMPPITFTFNKTGLCKNDTILLNAPVGSYTYNWFKNNNPATNSGNVFKASSPGDYKFRITDASGCNNTSAFVSIFNAPLPKTKITFASDSVQCLTNNSFSFTDATTIDSTTFNRQWKLGDGNVSALSGVQHSYLTVGSYPVSLMSISTYGCKDSSVKTIVVNPNPVIGVLSGPSSGLSAGVQYTYTVGAQLNHTYNWTLTNGNLLNGQGSNSINMKWINSGSGSVRVKVNNLQNCFDSTILNVNIGSTGLTGLTDLQALVIYPNPNNGSFALSADIKNAGVFNMEIFNAEGAIVHLQQNTFKLGSNEFELNLPLASGIYFLRISDGNSQLLKRFVVE